MNISEIYDYLIRTRKDLWATLEQAPDEFLSRPLAGEEWFPYLMTPHDDPEQHFTVDGLLWHVMIHEMRHTAQVAVLLRSQGIRPPSLDLLFYLPSA
jgi:uncharacterized damage-inducible protein DinB